MKHINDILHDNTFSSRHGILNTILPTILLLLSLLLTCTNAYALQLNLTLGQDIIDRQYKLNILYDLFPLDGAVSQQMYGINQAVFALWLQAFNQENKGMIANNNEQTKENSKISLGYRKDNKNIMPPSCQNIDLNNKDIINILLTKKGCDVRA